MPTPTKLTRIFLKRKYICLRLEYSSFILITRYVYVNQQMLQLIINHVHVLVPEQCFRKINYIYKVFYFNNK